MLLKLAVLVMLFTTAELSRYKCPFRNELSRSGKGYCERKMDYIKYLDDHPEQHFSRPDVELERQLEISEYDKYHFCCYEQLCLEQCGIDITEVFTSKVGAMFPGYVGKIVESYPKFFAHINASEIDVLESGKASSLLIEKWLVYLTHLNKNLAKSSKKQGF